MSIIQNSGAIYLSVNLPLPTAFIIVCHFYFSHLIENKVFSHLMYVNVFFLMVDNDEHFYWPFVLSF